MRIANSKEIRVLKDSVKKKISGDNMLQLRLAEVNDSKIQAVNAMISRDSQKLMHIDFLNTISMHLKIEPIKLTTLKVKSA